MDVLGSDQDDLKTIQEPQGASRKQKDDPRTAKQKRKIIRFGKMIWFSNFVTAPLVCFYIMVLYAIIYKKTNFDCQRQLGMGMLVTLAISDGSMLLQYFQFFAAVITHSTKGMHLCILFHSVSILLKGVGAGLMYHFIQLQRHCPQWSDLPLGIVSMPLVSLAIEFLYILIYLRLLRKWDRVSPIKWTKKFVLMEKQNRCKSTQRTCEQPTDENNIIVPSA